MFLPYKTKSDKPKYVRHCCPTCKKTEEEFFGDEMLRVTGREDQNINKVKHAGFDEFGHPCCCVWALEQCDDFKTQRNVVEELILTASHKVIIFLPKFHPELNFIENFCER